MSGPNPQARGGASDYPLEIDGGKGELKYEPAPGVYDLQPRTR